MEKRVFCAGFGVFPVLILLLALVPGHEAAAQAGGSGFDTVYIPVTFYDYRADGSHPDFENCKAMETKGMARADLGPDRKPLLAANVNCNENLEAWFRPYGVDSRGKFNATANRWNPGVLSPLPGRSNEWIGAGADTAQKLANIIIYDSLPFRRDKATGILSYDNQAFFPLTNKGFGNRSKSGKYKDIRNYGYTMEIHHEFLYQPGLSFDFTGDDDLLVYINGKLALDLGGIHIARPGRVVLDAAKAASLGLETGKRYTFDLFYAERHSDESTIKVTTNILSPPQTLEFYGKPGAPDPTANPPLPTVITVKAGEPIEIHGKVLDADGKWVPQLDKDVKWTVKEGEGQVGVTQGSRVNPQVTKAFQDLVLQGTAQDPNNPGTVFTGEIRIKVEPADPFALTFERSAAPDRFQAGAFDSVRLEQGEAPVEVHAFIRDRFGNLIGPAAGAVYALKPDTLALGAKAPAGTPYTLTWKPGPGGEGRLTAMQGGLSGDSLRVFAGPIKEEPSEIGKISFQRNPTRGERFDPHLVKTPLIVVDSSGNLLSSQETEKTVAPQMAASKGPVIKIPSIYPLAAVDLRFYDHLGQYVNQAKYRFAPGEWEAAKRDGNGDTSWVYLMWYPVAKGRKVATGAFIVQGKVETQGGEYPGPSGLKVRLKPSAQSVKPYRFGYSRAD